MKPFVFISYSSHDINVARRLATDLELRGIDTWFDENDLLPGDSLSQGIGKPLDTCTHVLFLVSESAVNSRWATSEVGVSIVRRVEEDVFIIPLRLDQTKMPSLLRDIKYVDMTEYDRGFEQLMRRFSGSRSSKARLLNQSTKNASGVSIEELNVSFDE